MLHNLLAEFSEGVGLVDAEQGVVTVTDVHAAQPFVHPLREGHLLRGRGEGGPCKHAGIVIHVTAESFPTANREENKTRCGRQALSRIYISMFISAVKSHPRGNDKLY